MDPNRWNTIKRIFGEACLIAATDRPAFVRNACGSDDELEREILELLRTDEETSPLLDGIEHSPPVFPSDDPAERSEHQRIGPYSILRELGRGGMGVVYLAERADRQFRKRLALKLVKRGMDTDEILHRFRHERQILASLEHPNIARLYDGGATDDGRPYLVMEYVEGEPITEYCDNRNLAIEQRLRLFSVVCSAVQYAHQNLIVHRDIKPSNVMVTKDGDVRLLDFGIAKLLQDPADGAGAVTRPWLLRVTPQYASPEQLRGSRVTTASDVYSLGILLYELLTGSHPWRDDGRAGSPYSVNALPPVEPPSVRIHKSDDRAIFASRQSSRNALSRRIKHDVDSIILTALHPDAGRRYQSAEQMLRDIERHLNGHPITAHPPSKLYHLKKFLGRNRAAAAFTFIIILMIAVFTIFTWMQNLEIARERDAATTERDKALQLAGFMEGLFEASNPFYPTPERIDTFRTADLLRRGADRVRRELSGRPQVQSQMFRSIGKAYMGMGLYDEAAVYLDEALSLRENTPEIDANELIESYADKGYLLYTLGKYPESEVILREALRLADIHPDFDELQTADVMYALGTTLSIVQKREEAEHLLRRALDVRRRVYGNEHPEIAASLSTLADLLDNIGKSDEAEEMHTETVRMRQALFGPDHPSVAVGYNNLANHYRNVGKFDEAEAAVREALRINRSTLGETHLHVTQNLALLGSILRFKGEYDEAENSIAASISLYREHHAEHRAGISVTLFAYSGLLLHTDRLDDAESVIRELLSISREEGSRSEYSMGLGLHRLGTILYRKGSEAESIEAFEAAIGILTDIVPATDSWLISAKQSLGVIQRNRGAIEAAEAILSGVYTDLRSVYSDDHPLVQSAISELVTLYRSAGNNDRMSYYSDKLR